MRHLLLLASSIALPLLACLSACESDSETTPTSTSPPDQDGGVAGSGGQGGAGGQGASAGGFGAGGSGGGPGGSGGAGGSSPLAGCITGNFTAFHGNFHAHTSYSDGVDEPEDAFAHARDVAGLDIMVVTDHLEQLYLLPPVNRWGLCKEQADAADQPTVFVADCGYEYGSGFILPLFQSTGHNNVFFPDSLFPAVQTDFHDFYTNLVNCAPCVGQFNHPGDEPTQHWNNFEYDAAVDGRMTLFELSGSSSAWDLYFQALDAGWHISPMLNQDNHSANWGTANDDRSGVFMTDLSRAALRLAMLDRRTFSSEDKNAAVRTMADGSCWMGSILTGGTTVTLTVLAEDDDPSDGFDTITLFGPGKGFLDSHACNGAVPCQATFTITTATSTYAVARAEQTDGDRLVAAPIWLTP
ncbi:MAG: hypothetical protein JRI68_09385 [Deltaproteobacteria bacterium]|nr:hypothetical protein [Deltaproteobacteria bacterium]